MADLRFVDVFNESSFLQWWRHGGSKPLEDLFPMFSAGVPWLLPPGPDFQQLVTREMGTEQDLAAFQLRASPTSGTTSPPEAIHEHVATRCAVYSQVPMDFKLPEVVGKRAKSKQGSEAKYIHYSACLGMLTQVYWSALYNPQFGMVVKSRGVDVPSHFFLGHRLGDHHVRGPVRSKVMIVDKGPGREEAEKRRNLAGPGGRILVDALREVGFSLSEISEMYVTNVMRFINPDISSDRISADVIKDCLPLLQLELRLVQPDYVLLLGVESIKAFLGKNATLNSTTGTPIAYEYDVSPQQVSPIPLDPPAEHIPEKVTTTLFTCYHPNRVEKEPQYRSDLNKQLSAFEKNYRARARGVAVTSGFDEELAGRDHRLLLTEQQLVEWVDEVIAFNPKYLAFDTEFEGLFPGNSDAYIRTIQFSWDWKKAVCIAINQEFNRGEIIPKKVVTRELKRLLDGTNARPVCHYAPADLPWVAIELNLPQVYKWFEAPADDPYPPNGDFTGWKSGAEKTRTEGGFDTILAGHAVEETQELDLLSMGMRNTTVGPYDRELNAYVEKWCSDGELNGTGKKIPRKKLTGYGGIPLHILWVYACIDADVTFRLCVVHNDGVDGKPALLDCDRFGHITRVPFWIASRAAPAFLEMKTEGMCIDKNQAGRIRSAFEEGRKEKLAELRQKVNWPSFNPNSVYDCRALLFGPHMTRKNGKIPYELPVNYQLAADGRPITERKVVNGTVRDVFVPLPDDQQPRTLNLEPYLCSGDKKLWSELVERGISDRYSPSTDKESLAQLGTTSPIAWDLRGIRYLTQIIQSLLKAPVRDKDGRDLDEDGNPTEDFEDMDYEDGILSFLCDDGRIRPNYSQTKETGRASTWKPTVQNISKRRDKDYRTLLGDKYPGPIRSFIVAPPGHVLLEFDYSGAELTFVAGQSGDANMKEAVRRMQLPGDGYDEYGNKVEGGVYPHPEHRCIHSSIAIKAFQLQVTPGCYSEKDLIFLRTCGMSPDVVHTSKWGLDKIKELRLRDAAKCVIFGYLYGMGPSSAMRKCKEEGVEVTLTQAVDLIRGLEELYPGLPAYFQMARDMVRHRRFLVTAYGRYRRFYPSSNEKIVAANEREGQNVPMQGGVADAVQLALAEFYHHPRRSVIQYKMQLQLHDAILFAVRPEYVDEMIQVIAPECMIQKVPVPVRSVDGTYQGNEYFNMAIDAAIYEQWGVKFKKDRAEALGIPAKYAA